MLSLFIMNREPTALCLYLILARNEYEAGRRASHLHHTRLMLEALTVFASPSGQKGMESVREMEREGGGEGGMEGGGREGGSGAGDAGREGERQRACARYVCARAGGEG